MVVQKGVIHDKKQWELDLVHLKENSISPWAIIYLSYNSSRDKPKEGSYTITE